MNKLTYCARIGETAVTYSIEHDATEEGEASAKRLLAHIENTAGRGGENYFVDGVPRPPMQAIALLRKKIADLNTELDQLRSAKSKAPTAISNAPEVSYYFDGKKMNLPNAFLAAMARINEMRETLTARDAELRKMSERFAEVTDERDTQKARADSWERACNEHIQTRDSLRGSLNDANARLTSLIQDRDRIWQERSNLEKQCKELTAELQRPKVEALPKVQSIFIDGDAQLRAELAEANAKIERLTGERDAQAARADGWKHANNGHFEECRALQAKLKALVDTF